MAGDPEAYDELVNSTPQLSTGGQEDAKRNSPSLMDQLGEALGVGGNSPGGGSRDLPGQDGNIPADRTTSGVAGQENRTDQPQTGWLDRLIDRLREFTASDVTQASDTAQTAPYVPFTIPEGFRFSDEEWAAMNAGLKKAFGDERAQELLREISSGDALAVPIHDNTSQRHTVGVQIAEDKPRGGVRQIFVNMGTDIMVPAHGDVPTTFVDNNGEVTAQGRDSAGIPGIYGTRWVLPVPGASSDMVLANGGGERFAWANNTHPRTPGTQGEVIVEPLPEKGEMDRQVEAVRGVMQRYAAEHATDNGLPAVTPASKSRAPVRRP